MQNESNYFDVTQKAYIYLKEVLNYKYVTIRHYRCRWIPVKEYMEKNCIINLDCMVCQDYLRGLYNGRLHEELTEHEKLIEKSVSVLKEFIETGQIVPKKKILHFDGEIGNVMKAFLKLKEDSKIKENTIEKNASHYSSFNFFLVAKDIFKIKDITPKSIINFIRTLDIKHPAKIHDTLSDLRLFFTYLFKNEMTLQNLAQYVPIDNYRSGSRLPSYYDESEIVSLLKTVDKGTKLGKRDYAILVIAAKLGLRASDIARLKFSDFHWESSTITLTQYKTDITITLPLLGSVGNAILDYIQYGRQESDEKHIFLQAIYPYKSMKPQTVSNMVQRYFVKSGLSNNNRRHGCHALRHSLVKELLSQGRSLPIITEVLGHKHIDSTRYYIRIDEEKLRQCTLDVPPVLAEFYIQKGGVSFYE